MRNWFNLACTPLAFALVLLGASILSAQSLVITNQGYIAVDLGTNVSGSTTNMAMDDSGNVAFGILSGNYYYVYNWTNGVLTPRTPLNLTQTNGGVTYKLTPSLLQANGEVYGVMLPQGTNNTKLAQPGFSAAGNSINYIGLPAPYTAYNNYGSLVMLALASDGSYAADIGYCFDLTFYGEQFGSNPAIPGWTAGIIVRGSGQNIAQTFDTEYAALGGWLGGYMAEFHYTNVVFNGGPWETNGYTTIANSSEIYYPSGINTSGCAIGKGYGLAFNPYLNNDSYGYQVWNEQYQTFYPLNSSTNGGTLTNGDVPVGINNQNSVIVQGYSTNGSGTGGYLWENGATTYFSNVIAGNTNATNISDIQPLLISDQASPGVDSTIQVVAHCNNNGTDETVILSRGNSGSWNSLSAIQFPAGISISKYIAVNANGEIAAIGGNGHALILLPVTLSEILFSGSSYWQLISDNGETNYDQPQWVASSQVADQCNFPIAYTQGSVPVIAAGLTVGGATNVVTLKVQATNSNGINIPPTTAVYTNGYYVIPYTAATNSWTNAIEYYSATNTNAFTLNWLASGDGGTTWVPIGTTKHTVYLTLGDPVQPQSQYFESVFEIGCSQAQGMTTNSSNSAIINAIWGDFANRNVKRVDGTTLTYYHDYQVQAAPTFYQQTAVLLANGDGQCSSWASLFLDVLKAQGMQNTNNYVEIKAINGNGFAVNNWNFASSGNSTNLSYPFLNVATSLSTYIGTNSYNWIGTPQVTQGNGIPGQGNSNPASLFNNHQMAFVNGQYYDPSYGLTHTSLVDFQTSLAGFYTNSSYVTNGSTNTGFLFQTNSSTFNLTNSQILTY